MNVIYDKCQTLNSLPDGSKLPLLFKRRSYDAHCLQNKPPHLYNINNFINKLVDDQVATETHGYTR